MNWLADMFGKQEKKAELIDDGIVFERKVKSNDWILDTMKTDEEAIAKEEQAKDAKELEVRIEKKAASEMNESQEDTIRKDYELKVKGLSNYNLAEMLAERLASVNENMNEEKAKQLKSVESNREAAEVKLLKLIGEHSVLDWKAAFEKFKEAKIEQPKAEELYKPEFETGKQNWEKKEEFEAPADKEKIEEMKGVGKEEDKKAVGNEELLEEQRKAASLEKKADDLDDAKMELMDHFKQLPPRQALATLLSILEPKQVTMLMSTLKSLQKQQTPEASLERKAIYPDDIERHPEYLVFKKEIKIGPGKIVVIGAVTPFSLHQAKRWVGTVTTTTYAVKANMGSSGAYLFDADFDSKEEAIEAIKKFEQISVTASQVSKIEKKAEVDIELQKTIDYWNESDDSRLGYNEEKNLFVVVDIGSFWSNIKDVREADIYTPEEFKRTIDDARIISSQGSKIEKKACHIGEKVYYRGHPAVIKDIFINTYSEEPHVDIEIDGKILSLSGKELKQLGAEPLMEEMKHKDVPEKKEVEFPKDPLEEKIELPVELPKKEEPEIESKVSKEEVIKKIAEINSPWTVVKNEKGEDVIARTEPVTQEKESVKVQEKLCSVCGFNPVVENQKMCKDCLEKAKTHKK